MYFIASYTYLIIIILKSNIRAWISTLELLAEDNYFSEVVFSVTKMSKRE